MMGAMASADRTGGVLQPFAMDVRSLAAFRIGVARDPTYEAPVAWRWLGKGLFLQQDFRMFGRHAAHAGGRLLDSFELVSMRRPVRPEPPYRVPQGDYERHVTWRHWCFG
jgi:hypothetical protein